MLMHTLRIHVFDHSFDLSFDYDLDHPLYYSLDHSFPTRHFLNGAKRMLGIRSQTSQGSGGLISLKLPDRYIQ